MATLTLSSAAKQARLTSLNTLLGNSALIKIFTGSIPASPDIPPAGTLLSTLTGSAAGFGTVLGSAVNLLTLGAPGAGYTSAPTVSFTGGGGTGAAATAIIAGGALSQITITNPGSGYTTPPTVTLTAGGFSTAAAAPVAVLGAVLQAGTIAQDNSAVASGVPGWARLSSSANAAVLDVDCSGLGGPGAMQIAPGQITQGAPVTCGSFLIDET